MIVLITGASHTGKTLLAQRMLAAYRWPYLSIDHLKMGLIRSGQTDLTPEDDDKLTAYLWPIVREMIKTAIENGQNLIVEGCYVPFDWRKDFGERYLREIRFLCLTMTDGYIDRHFGEIKRYACAIEARLDDASCTPDSLKTDNRRYAEGFTDCGEAVTQIGEDYSSTINTLLKEIGMEHKQYEARARWGDTAAYKEYEQKSKGRSAAEQDALNGRLMDIFREFGAVRDGDPAAAEAQALVRKLQEFLTANYYRCTDEILSGLGKLYGSGGEFTKNIDAAAGEGTAVFAAKAIEARCAR